MNRKDLAKLLRAIEELRDSIQAEKAKLDEVLINSDQMERILRCSPSTLQRFRKKGIVPCTQIGRRYYYPKHFFTQEVINSIIKPNDPSKGFDDKT
ncbi:helix-turn-helix domain-containing protein [Flavobacterium sp. XGLA_31]|uniref:helix-turn-helix domain-containing protein n=1 Tax=Flavobacterium sp. XGLA_31 TaxID=3447666 RepID=UPI003F2A41B8